jgi:secreted Zn-dependent insulinase-like peptidase
LCAYCDAVFCVPFFVEGEYTIYQFVVSGEKETFVHALDIFAQCFISPLLSSSCSDREINSIESEFQLAKTSDGSRMQQIFCGNCTNTTVTDGETPPDLASQHVLKKFGWGNNFSLKTVPAERGGDVNVLLREFYQQHYVPGRMKLVVLSPLPMEAISDCVGASFAPWMQSTSRPPVDSPSASPALLKKPKLSNGDCAPLARAPLDALPTLSDLLSGAVSTGIPANDRYPQHHAFPYKVCAFPVTGEDDAPSAIRVIRMVPIKNVHSLSLKFQLPCTTGLYGQKLESYYGHLFGHEGKGSVLALLKSLNYATGLSAGVSHLRLL